VFSNGVIYMMKSSYFMKEKSFRTQNMHYIKISYLESLDIDTQKDFVEVESLIRNQKIKP
jgi:CMP-N-acetylneuraminic acid synthetase